MSKSLSNNYSRGFVYIELILVVIIILFLMYKLLNLYFKKPIIPKEAEETILKEGINTSSYNATVDSIKEKLKNIEEQHAKSLDELMHKN